MKLRVAKTLLVFIILIVLFLFIAVSFLIAKFDQNHNHDGIALAVVDGNWTYDLKDNISQSAGYSDLTTYLNGTYNKEIKYENLNSGQISNFTYTFDAIPLKKPSETANPSVTPWMEYAYNNTYNETEFKKDNMTGTPHSTAQNGSPDGSNIDVGIGSSKKTLAGKMVRFYTIISYNLNITFDDTLIEAMKNNRVEFRLTQCNLTDLYLGQTEKDLQFSYVSTDSGVSISDLKNAINTDYNSTELKTFYSRGLENETINFPGPGIEIKYTNKDINYIDNNDDNWFTPTFSLNDKNITIQLQTSHSNEPDDWYTKGTYCYITTPPVIVLSMRYKLSEIEFKVNNTNYGSIVAPDQGGSHTYEVDLESKYNGVTLAATAVSKNGYAFLYWTSQQNVGDNYFSPELSVIPLYEHNKNDDSGGKITYEAVFEQIRFTDLLNEQHSEYYYTNTGQGPRAYLAYAFGEGVTNKVTHKYGDDPSQSKDVTTTSSASISGFDQIKPKVVGQYKYSVTFYRLIEINQNYTYVSVGETTTNYEIKKHTPSASTDIIQLDPYYYGQKLTTSIIKLADGSNNAYVSDTKVQGIDSKIQGKFWFADNEYNSGETRLKTTRYGVQIKFIPTDTININEIILDNTVTLTVLKTTLKLGYLNENALIPGLEGLNLNVINYGQLRTDLGITDKIILYNEYTYNDSNALSDPYFGYVPYTISDWGGIQNRPASTTLTTVNLSFALNSYIGESQTSYSSVYNLPLGNITIGYTVNKAKLVFEVLNEKVIKYQYNHYLNYMNENVLSTVYNNENIELMYGQGLKVINISSTGKINSNVPSYIDTGTIRFSWYSQVGGVIGDSLTDYYEQKLLNVSDSTNPSNTQNPKYYCLKAEWMNVDGNAVNTNYEPYYMYNQSIIIVKAKLNESIDFAQSTESGNPDITVVRPIIYGTSVNSALSQNYNIGTTLNLINKDLEVYYKIEWIVDKQSGSVANLENYPYALVSDSASYPVQITVYKKPISGSDWIIDDDNYEQNGVFTRNENGQPFSYAKLTVNHAEQEFYVMVGDELAALNNANLTKSLVEYNDYIYEETTVGLKIGSDTNIDIETLYVDGKNTFNIILYTSAVIYKGDNQFADINGVNKAGVTITPLDPLNYNNIVFSTATYSLEYFNGTPYTRINLILTLAPNAKTTPGVVSFVLGQYDSGHELTNPIGGNYKSKEWNPLQLVGDPYTLFIKLNKKPTGLKAASIKNPDDNTDTRLYSYSVTYGDYVEITPGAQVKGSLECAEEYNQIEIVDQSDEVEKYYILASATGAYNLIYTAPGHVDTSKPLSNPYMPVSENIWIYVAKKSANVNLALVDNNAFSITYGTLSPEFKFEEGLYFAGDDFSYIKKVIKLITLGVNSEDYISGLVLPVNTYYIGALIDLESNTIEGLSSDELANARDIANRYKITFNAGEFVVTQKKVTITFTDSSQYTEGGDGKIFEIDYFDDKLLDANTYPYLYEFNGILESENLDDVIGNSTTRPSVRAMTTTDSISYYPISARPDAGSYEIKLYVPVNCPAVNYEFDIERAILRVKTRDVTLDFDEVEQDYTSTSYTFANNAKVSGIKGATSPTGNLIIKFLKTGTVVSENTEFLISLQHAGVYDVYVSYLSGNLDNYNDTDKVFSEYIIINRIDPIVTLPSHNSTYDGIQITYPYNIRGIAADYTLPGETLVYYSTNGSDYSESIPTNAGEYYVKLSYTSAATDNYNTIDVTSDGAVITIKKASLSITSSKLASKLMKTYDAKYINELDDIIVVGAVVDGTISNEYLDIYYQRTGATEWTLWSTSSTPIDVGNYDVRLDYRTNDNQNISHNYSITSVSYRNGAIIISQRPLESISVKNEFKITKDYNGIRSDIAVDSNHVIIEYGIESSDVTPTTINYSDISIEYAKVTYDGNAYDIGAYSSLAPMDAGSYIVRLTYNSKSASNYENGKFSISEIKTDEELSSNVKIEIKKIKPTISYTTTKLPYNAQNQAFTRYSVKGIGNEKPKGAFTIYYQKFGTTDEWVTTTPKDIAKYNIKIEFIAASTENYTNAEAEYSGIFEIINGNLSVTLLYRQDKYQGVKVDEAKPTILKPDGKPVDFAVVKIRYRLNGAEDLEWSIATPSASGWYDVLIEVEQDESLTYIRYSNVFERILRILNPEPIFDITAYTRTYNGAAQSLPLANILLTNSITIEGGVKVNDISEELTGYISLRYSQDGNTWTSALPKNVGLYSIKIIYTEGEDDHFATIETSAYNVKYTITPMTLIVVPDSGLTKVYDAIPVSGDLITYTFANNIGPYENDTKTGTLIVGNDSKSVGSYQIGKGSLNYGSNYDVRLTATPVYFTVTKRSIAPIFEDISYVYDGTPKMPSVYINKTELAGSDVESDVNLNRVIENANINSGTFKVTVSIPGSSNYKLSDDFNPVRVYVIDDAKMTQNLFITNEKIIYYDGDKHELKLDSREPGADVKYYRILNIEDEEIEEIAGTYVEIGEYNIKAVVTKINYEKQTLYATLKIVKGKIEVNIILPEGELYYGKALPSIGTSAQGTVSLDSNQELTPGTGFYNWTFIPQDEEHYEIVNGTIELTVNKATPDIKIEGSLDQVEGSSESLEIKVYVDNIQHTVPYKTYYKDTNGTVYYSVPTAPGTYSVFIEVEGNEFIAPQTFEKEFVVARKSIIWPYILAGIAGSLFILALMFVGFRRKASVR